MVLAVAGQPLQSQELARPKPSAKQILLQVKACAVCRTDLHVLDGELADSKANLIPGHEIVGQVLECGEQAHRFQPGDRVGVPWLGQTCGTCMFCQNGEENLCPQARFTGYHLDGGYAQYTVAHEDFCFALPERFDDVHAAPLLCAGLIGYRALRMTGSANTLGLYGFGAAAHIVTQVAVFQGRKVHAFTKPSDHQGQKFARSLGAVWAGDSLQQAPEPLDAAILFAPVGSLVPRALQAVRPGGVVVCAGIHMSDIPSFPYQLLWGERCLRSVANLTRRDGEEFMALAAKIPLQTEVECLPLSQANQALQRLRDGQVKGAAVLIPD